MPAHLHITCIDAEKISVKNLAPYKNSRIQKEYGHLTMGKLALAFP